MVERAFQVCENCFITFLSVGGHMNLSRLRRVALALAFVSVVVAAAATASVRSSKAVTLTFWQTMNTEETATLKALVDKFEASHSSIKVNMVYVPFDQRDAKFTAAAQA